LHGPHIFGVGSISELPDHGARAGVPVSQTDWAPGNEPHGIRPLEDFAPLEQALTAGVPFSFDVTAAGEAREVSITQAVAEIAENRAVVEQAKGVLMYVYQVDADAAFDVLKWRSQETKVELCALAEQLLADIRTLGHDDDSRSYGSIFEFDRLLLTIHERMRAKAARK
jgi:ANTAR domain